MVLKPAPIDWAKKPGQARAFVTAAPDQYDQSANNWVSNRLREMSCAKFNPVEEVRFIFGQPGADPLALFSPAELPEVGTKT